MWNLYNNKLVVFLFFDRTKINLKLNTAPCWDKKIYKYINKAANKLVPVRYTSVPIFDNMEMKKKGEKNNCCNPFLDFSIGPFLTSTFIPNSSLLDSSDSAQPVQSH